MSQAGVPGGGRLALAILAASLTAGCAITAGGSGIGAPPPAVQGANDAQGSPLSVPGSGMGVGSGNPGAAETGSAAGR
ncbi:hypothetical protein [Noviherbaspirillum galbum]|uniref:Uncharacterized protein n=1 Tax=Noviherbaspirillum galbum TaxID=2709383 RepID=A0A6B3SSF9_9BURK|nr:hypothetical protein [Noviherbaspirillum galbum]NEX63591.1 hypothetical protein [Noviherbaspirillum galbum]